MAGHENGSILQFAPFQSAVDESFWHRLSSLKLNELGIDESPISITGFYAPCSHSQVSNHLTLLTESFPPEPSEQSSIPAISHGNKNRCSVPGILYNTNTLESFLAFDKQSLLKAEAKKIWKDIHSGKAEDDCAVLSRFLLISFADLKKWSFHYWFAFPALVLDPPATLIDLRPASPWLSLEEAESLSAACNEWRNSHSTTDVPFFLVDIASNSCATIRHLKEWKACQCDGHKFLFGFYDPCHLPNNPGWPLRNFLAFICSRWDIKKVQFLCYRENHGFADLGMSLVGEASICVPQGRAAEIGDKVSRRIGLAKSMDPTRLAISAADLNLKLMRWRGLPSLNLNILAATKCLLLGAGTVGCQVARMLVAWGIRKITLLDSGKVAMSNPLRQSLYILDDCLNGGEFKATSAVKSLKRIFPAVEAEGVVMAIPMPGHPVPSLEENSVLEDFRRLHDLIESYDAVFLLTDTRESPWLPTLLCANANKITVPAALGFDSFLVMRHGAGPLGSVHEFKAETVNALAAEVGNFSLMDRSGRQRLVNCQSHFGPAMQSHTWLAPIASALAVELLVSILHHPDGLFLEKLIFAKAEFANSIDSRSTEQPLGILPHQIRGSLSQFSQMTLMGHSSTRCTACCSTVVSEYKKRGMEFILQAINHPTYLEDLTGLTELMKSASSFKLDMDNEMDGDGDDCIEL